MSLHPRQLRVTFVQQHFEPTSVLNIAVGAISMHLDLSVPTFVTFITRNLSTVQITIFWGGGKKKASLLSLVFE